MNYCTSFVTLLTENAKTFQERRSLQALTESETNSINNTMVTNLYKSALDKAFIDFDDIPNSKGDITKYSGYTPMVNVISLLKEVSKKANVKIDELDTIEQAISNIITYRDAFDKGYKLEKQFIILTYNSLVYACIQSVSYIVSSYVDFIKRPNTTEFTIIRNTKLGGATCISSLATFNMAVKQGDFSKVLSTIISSGKQEFVGTSALIIPVVIIAGTVALVTVIRELIFFYFFSRMRISDYLNQQALLLEINKNTIQMNSNVSAKEKNQIMKKQQDTINLLHSLSDKIMVGKKMAESKASEAIRDENKGWTLDRAQTVSSSSDSNGFQLL